MAFGTEPKKSEIHMAIIMRKRTRKNRSGRCGNGYFHRIFDGVQQKYKDVEGIHFTGYGGERCAKNLVIVPVVASSHFYNGKLW
jgi:hypothetical protein